MTVTPVLKPESQRVRSQPNAASARTQGAVDRAPIDWQQSEQLGTTIHELVSQLYPICRSITGDGVRATLAGLQQHIPLVIHEVPTGTRAFDWTVPQEWNIRDAYIKDAQGRRVVDFQSLNLHVVNYSVPVRTVMTLAELRPRLHSLPEHPTWVPYRTSYYREDWGFCLSHERLQSLPEGNYEVCIDSSLQPGSLSYGEVYLPGQTTDEVLISSHVCHPSLANDNLSSVAVATLLARWLGEQKQRRYSYRFLFAPGTIGAITWLSQRRDQLNRIRHGLVLALVGADAAFTYKRSRRGTAEIDQAMAHVLRQAGVPHSVCDFEPMGYDERQYCSPGIDLPVGCLMRTPPGKFPEYHTSADNLNFLRPQRLAETWQQCRQALQVLEGNRSYRNMLPECEPQLGRRGLYSATGGRVEQAKIEQALLWVLNYSDCQHSLLEIADRAQLPFAIVREAADLLLDRGLLEELDQA